MDGRQGGRNGEGGREGGARAKPGNQLVIYNAQYELHLRVGGGGEFRVNMLDSESVVVTARPPISSLQSCML